MNNPKQQGGCIYSVMILVCPHCGTEIDEALINGLASCTNCKRVFDSSLSSRLLSASWLVRKNNYHGIDQLISDTKLPEHEAILVYTFCVDNCYSQEEFFHALRELGIQ
jgi:hypothetical protein